MAARRTHPQRVIVAERRNKAVQMRAGGHAYEAIALTLGYKTASAACQDVQRHLAASAREATEEVRAIELQRLDTLWQVAMDVMARSHVTVSQGRVVELNGQPLQDDGPALAAIDRLLKIQERRAKLLGLDAPTKHEVVTMDAVEAEIARLNAELAATPDPDRAEAREAAAAPGPPR